MHSSKFTFDGFVKVTLGFTRERQIIVKKIDHELVAVINSVPLAGDRFLFSGCHGT
jgi:hypothetical protein